VVDSPLCLWTKEIFSFVSMSEPIFLFQCMCVHVFVSCCKRPEGDDFVARHRCQPQVFVARTLQVLSLVPCRCRHCVARTLQASTLCCAYPAGVVSVLCALQVSTSALTAVDTVLRAGGSTLLTARVPPVLVTGSVDSDDHASDDSVTSSSLS
jgi:hypothetical protein